MAQTIINFSTMGETTSLGLNTANKASLRTTVPMFIVKQWGLKPGHQLDWSLEVCNSGSNNELVVVVRKVKAKK
jgi:hypothetical protein